jgi:hypothetical protein
MTLAAPRWGHRFVMWREGSADPFFAREPAEPRVALVRAARSRLSQTAAGRGHEFARPRVQLPPGPGGPKDEPQVERARQAGQDPPRWILGTRFDGLDGLVAHPDASASSRAVSPAARR